MSGDTLAQAHPVELLVFGHTLDSLFNGVLGNRLTPEFRERLREAGLDLSQPVRSAYSLHIFENCLELAAQHLYSDMSRTDALCALGEAQVDAFTNTIVGRASFSFMKLLGVRRSLERLTHSWRNANNFVQSRVREISPGTFEVWVNEVGRQPESVLGVLRGFLRHVAPVPYQVTPTGYDGHSCTYLLEPVAPQGGRVA